jgi:hypothetical protein
MKAILKDQIKYYQIRRKSDGLYSTGGQFPTFNQTGKTWKNIGHVKSHMRLGREYGQSETVRNNFYQPEDNFEIVEAVFEKIEHRYIPLQEI